jgi:predicted metal-dependent enzyme (double-stranded beta helix superfamily)
MKNPPPSFARFEQAFTALVDRANGDEAMILAEGRKILGELVSQDNWLPEPYAQPHPQYYQQYLLHADPQDRFSVVSFVWGPGQKTPIHNHTVWALIGMLRGSERAENFAVDAEGHPTQVLGVDILEPGTVESLSPTTGDVHRVSNLYDDRVSISVHVYGGNIGRISRSVFDAETGMPKHFISGYTNEHEVSAA